MVERRVFKRKEKMTYAYNQDCMIAMKEFPDKYFELAIIDPPYGGDQNFNFRFGTGENVYKSVAPTVEFWNELFRVSVNQIVWGGNYFTDFLKVNRCWVSWYKENPAPNFSDFELAWTSFDRVSKAIRLKSYGFNHPDTKNGDKTVHPTQKPVSLYRELLKDYAKQGDKILDTHLGSGSSRIAAHQLGFEFYGYELDADYFEAQEKRFKLVTSQEQIQFPKSA